MYSATKNVVIANRNEIFSLIKNVLFRRCLNRVFMAICSSKNCKCCVKKNSSVLLLDVLKAQLVLESQQKWLSAVAKRRRKPRKVMNKLINRKWSITNAKLIIYSQRRSRSLRRWSLLNRPRPNHHHRKASQRSNVEGLREIPVNGIIVKTLVWTERKKKTKVKFWFYFVESRN
jgi:hypothetical protein